MGTTNVTNPLVQPSQNDLGGGVSGDGNTALEKYVRKLFLVAGHGQSYVISGGLLPATQATLIQSIPAGEAYISGYYVTWPTTSVSLPASTTSHIFVKLVFASGVVSGIQVEDNTTGIEPADAVKLGINTTNASTITSRVDQRLLNGNQRIRRAVIAATGSTDWTVPSNVTAVHVRQWGAGGGGGGGGGNDGLAGQAGTGAAGTRGAYVQTVLTVSPGETITITNGTGGSGGAGGGAGGYDGSTGGNGGSSSIVKAGVNFTAGGGAGGRGGTGSIGGGQGQSAMFDANSPGIASQSAGTADLLIHGAGRSGGSGNIGAATVGAGLSGAAGQHGITIIEY